MRYPGPSPLVDRVKHFRMDYCLNAAFFSSAGRITHRCENVLSVPWFDLWDIPYLPPKGVIARVSMIVEKFLPILGPFAVYVMLSLLARACCREQDAVRVQHKRRNQRRCGIC